MAAEDQRPIRGGPTHVAERTMPAAESITALLCDVAAHRRRQRAVLQGELARRKASTWRSG
jgi:hypothetical protein